MPSESRPEPLSPVELAFRNLFTRPPPAGAPDDYWYLAAIDYPKVESAANVFTDAKVLREPLALSERWTTKVVADAFHPRDPPTWFALRKSALGTDALFTGWIARERWIQVASARYELHVRTPLGPIEDRSQAGIVAGVLRVASTLLQCHVDAPEHYALRMFDAYLTGSSILSSASGWRAFTFATDGVGVKYSVLKFRERAESKGSPTPPDPSAWFGP
ncbi:MAG: hypothetical protein U0414_42945 [Polyangiaceae bacterium]